MHIHGNSMNVGAASFYSTGNGARSIAAERAAEVRKKLLKGVANVDGAETPEETVMIGRWLNPDQSQDEGDAEHHSAASGKDSDFG